MKSEDVFWHDCRIVRVVESPTKAVAFQVRYPENWEQNLFEDKTILFGGLYTYEIHEGACHGSVTMLSASEESGDHNTRCLRLETTAGYREIRFKTLELLPGHVAS